MKTYDHIIRFTLLVIIVVLGFLIVRSSMVPESFGVHGSYTYAYYRAESESEQAALPAVYQDTQLCSSCHALEAATLGGGTHSTLSCESCHGSFKAHNNNTPGRMAVADTAETCLTCHAALSARPSTFPQISSFQDHMNEQEEELLPDMSCATCHDPHEPM